MCWLVFALFAIGFVAGISNTTQCSSFPSCKSCTAVSGCYWCMAKASCTTLDACPLTPYSDCCYLHQSCSGCVLDPNCKFCALESVQFCQHANITDTCPKAESNCANPSYSTQFFQSFLYGIFIVVGSSLLLLSVSLFIFYIYTQHKKNIAKMELEKLYHDKNEVTETIAVYETKLSERPQDGYTTLAPLIMRLND